MVAIIGLIGVLGAALISHWDKIFTPNLQEDKQNKMDLRDLNLRNNQPFAEHPDREEKPLEFRVVEAFLRADPSNHAGPCPVTIHFSGRISVVGGSGTVSYKFIRSDGASAPIQTLHFDSPGSKDIHTTWTLGGPYTGWQAVHIFEPNEIESERAEFRIQCHE